MIKFYDFKPAPSPTRVRMFIAEKNLKVETINVNLMKREHHEESFRKINPWLTLPVIELEDGTTISEISACCRYLEEIHPNPFLMGKDAKEKALIEMCNAHI
jgi:glutathione S-transferase